MAKNTELAGLDQRISELTQEVRERFTTLKRDVSEKEKELQQLSEHFQRITGKALLPDAGLSQVIKPGPKAHVNGKAKRKGKRTRKPGVTIEWLQGHLGKKGMTVRELQEKAEEDGLSGLRIAAILKENKGKFKSQPGERLEGVKGIPGAVWGVK